MVSMIKREVHFENFQVPLKHIVAGNITKLKFVHLRRFNFVFDDTKADSFFIIEGGCQRIINRYV